MHDIDKILEAEQNIQNIAAELAKMRDAANFLQEAQKNSDAIINAAQQLIQATERFSRACGAIITNLASTDLTKKLDSLQKLHSEIVEAKIDLYKQIAKLLEEYAKAWNVEIAKVSTQLQELQINHNKQITNLLEEHAKAWNVEIAKVSTQLQELQIKHINASAGEKARSIIIMVFAILGFLTTTGSLVTLLIQR